MPSANRPSDTVCSYSSVHDLLGAKTSSYADKYKQFVIDYALEWEKVVTERINAGLKKAELLRRDLDHYQKKTEALRLSVNQVLAKGKSVKSDTQEKLRRNEEKLMSAKQSYNKAATDLCILMEEITERSWRDLHPLLVKAAQFDTTLSNDESKVLGSLNQVVSQLKQIATSNGLSPQPRLKDLASLQPELLSTRPGGVAGLAIEAGPGLPSPLGTSSSAFDNQALMPGSVAPQGLGGFPVQISSSATSGGGGGPPSYGRSESSSSNFDPLSPLSMLSISASAAPAPTYDDLYSSTNVPQAPHSANLPPLGPRDPPPRSSSYDGFSPTSMMGNAAPQRSPSFAGSDVDSAFSGYSGYYTAPPQLPSSSYGGGIAPAPSSAPPLPPSMPPPPPPSTAMTLSDPSYGGDNYSAPPPMQQQYQQQPPPANTNPFNY